MSSDERLLNIGRLQEKEQQAQMLAIRIHGLKESFRKIGDPHRPLSDLKWSDIQSVSEELLHAQNQFERLVGEISRLRNDLGMGKYEHP